MSINKIIFLSLLVTLLAQKEPPTYYDDLTCGKDKPKKPKDCYKYGTGSGMVCCWISNSEKTNGKCRLVPDQTARAQGISGEFTYGTEVEENLRYWSCGNKANYIYFNLMIILLFLFLFLL